MKLILAHAAGANQHIRVMTFQCASAGVLPEYTAGSHLEFDLGSVGTRAYSLIDWPDMSGHYTIAVQLEPEGEGGSQAMHALKVGQQITAIGPHNSFPLTETDNPSLLLAGGIGITPLISMATQLQRQGSPFQLHYTARDASRMGFVEPLNTAFVDNVKLYLDNANSLDLPKLMRLQAPNTLVYLCGPRGMINAARNAAIASGINEDNIHIELFTSAAPDIADTAFDVEISSTGQVVNVAADQTIIEALESAGIDVMYDCQRGDCGICQCDVISGIPDHRDVVLSEAERAAGNVMQICVSRAKSSRLVIDI